MKEAVVIALVGPLVTVALAWMVGHRLSTKWNDWQKRREQARTAANEFSRLYGEFFVIWKLWNYSLCQPPDAGTLECRRWELLKILSSAEAGIEALLMRVASERPLEEADIESLGCFRQGYQRLRESIRDRRSLDWASSDHKEYRAFKRLAVSVYKLVSAIDSRKPFSSQDSQQSFEKITSNHWETRWINGASKKYQVQVSFFRWVNLLMPRRKKIVSLQLDPDVLAWFKDSGCGYPTKINAVIKAYIEEHR